MTSATLDRHTGVAPTRWDDGQARFYAETVESSDYVARVAPLLDARWDSFLDVGAGSGALGVRLIRDDSHWQAVEPQPAMRELLERQRRVVTPQNATLEIHACPWQDLPRPVRARQLLAANLGATHHDAAAFFDAMADRWHDSMHWVVAAQAGPSTFCLAGFLPPELHGSDVRPAFERTLDQLGHERAPVRIRFVDWHCRFVFPDLPAAQAHFLDRLALIPSTPRGADVCRHVARHASQTVRGVEVGCAKRSAVMAWIRR